MSILADKRFWSVALSHMCVDIMNGGRSVLFAFLAVTLGLSNASLGAVTMAYLLIGAISQPISGLLSDRWGARWVIVGGVLWMGAFFTLTIALPGWAALAVMSLGSIGSGAVHPAGAAEATRIGQLRMGDKETTTSSYFFIFGQLGFFLGPILAGSFLGWWGQKGALGLTLWAIPAALFAAGQLQSVINRPAAPGDKTVPAQANLSSRKALLALPVLALVIITAFQSWVQQNIATFLPKYLIELGEPTSVSGLLSGLFVGGGAIGVVTGGFLADRYGKRPVIVVSMVGGSLPILWMAWLGYSTWFYPLVFLTGLLTTMCFSTLVVLAQRLIPGGMALASGLILGFMFSAGALGILVTGVVADALGLQAVFLFTALLSLAGGMLAPLLAIRKSSQVEPEAALSTK